jgi:hypothetical protein
MLSNKKKTARGVKKKFVVKPFSSHKFHNRKYFIFEMLKENIWANFQRIIEVFTKSCHQALENMGSRSGKTYPGSRGQKGHRIRIRGTG